VGADYTKRDVSIKFESGVVSVRCQIWDIAGQDRFAHLTRAYFNKADGVCIVCDVSRQETVKQVKVREKGGRGGGVEGSECIEVHHTSIYDALATNSSSRCVSRPPPYQEWKSEVDRCLGPNVPCLLFCNKSDLPFTGSHLQTGALIQQVCRDNDISRWFETSAKEGDGVDDGFNYVVRECLRRGEGRGGGMYGRENPMGTTTTSATSMRTNKMRKNSNRIKIIQKGDEIDEKTTWADVCSVC